MNNNKKIGLLVVAVVIAIIAAVMISGNKNQTNQYSDQSQTQPQQTVVVEYSCDAKKSIKAVFHSGEAKFSTDSQPPIPGGSVDVVLSDGRNMTLAQTISADGVRYANSDESFVFWSKGNGALVLENSEQKSYVGCITVADVPNGSLLTQIYSRGADGFSLRLPAGYSVDDSYKYQASPLKIINGVKFTIPKSTSYGTNLGSDSYISVEQITNNESQECTASEFFDGTHVSEIKTGNGVTYSVATSSGAGAGNRYEETVFAIPETNPCIAVRYFVHYGVFQNYPAGTTREFDSSALLNEFESIRNTLVVNR